MGSFLSSEENQNDDNENTGGGFGLNDSEKEYTDSDYLMEEIPVTYEIGEKLLQKYGSVRKAVDFYISQK
jgi:hypothetical protein